VAGSDWLPRQCGLNLSLIVFVGLDEGRNLRNKGGCTRRIARSLAFWILLLAAYRNVKIN
jgi:hypothetical protein